MQGAYRWLSLFIFYQCSIVVRKNNENTIIFDVVNAEPVIKTMKDRLLQNDIRVNNILITTYNIDQKPQHFNNIYQDEIKTLNKIKHKLVDNEAIVKAI